MGQKPNPLAGRKKELSPGLRWNFLKSEWHMMRPIKKKSGRDSPTEQLSHIPIRPNSPGFDGFFRKQRAFWSLMIHGHESLVTFLMKQASEQLKGEGE
jgi:hypothetical protein